MILAGLEEAPSGSECATSSISNTDGPPKLVLLLERAFNAHLACKFVISFLIDGVSLLGPPSALAAPSESEAPAPSPPCVELELSLRNKPMIDLGCFGFSIPPNIGEMIGENVVKMDWKGKRKKYQQIYFESKVYTCIHNK